MQEGVPEVQRAVVQRSGQRADRQCLQVYGYICKLPPRPPVGKVGNNKNPNLGAKIAENPRGKPTWAPEVMILALKHLTGQLALG